MNVLMTRQCARCGRDFTPKTVRGIYCSGSCRALAGRARKQAAAVTTTAAVSVPAIQVTPQSRVRTVMPSASPAWEPAVSSDTCVQTAEPCPDCGQPLYATLRGTRRACVACRRPVVPRGVRAPYERDTAAGRQVKSQRERDAESKAAVLEAGRFLRMVRDMLADPGIPPAAADLLAWYGEEITEARRNRDGRRLAELGAEFAADFAAVYEDQDQAAKDSYVTGQVVTRQAVIPGQVVNGQVVVPGQLVNGRVVGEQRALPAVPAAPRPMTWADALARLGWRLVPRARGCEVSEGGPPCRDEVTQSVGDGLACQRHFGLLAELIGSSQR